MDQPANPDIAPNLQLPRLSMDAANDNAGQRHALWEHPSPTRDAWTRVNRATISPAAVDAFQQLSGVNYLPAIENFNPVGHRGAIDEKNLRALDVGFPTVLVQSYPHTRMAYGFRPMQATQDAPLRQQIQDFQQAPRNVQVPDIGQLPNSPSLEESQDGPEDTLADDEAQHGDAAIDNVAINDANENLNTLLDNASTPKPFGNQNNDTPTSELPALNRIVKSSSTRKMAARHIQPSPVVGRPEMIPYKEVNASIQAGLQDNDSAYASDSELKPPSAGYIRSPVTGQFRKRLMTDDFPESLRRERDRKQWEAICRKPAEERGPIEGYEQGDSDLELSDWEEEKIERRRHRNKRRKL